MYEYCEGRMKYYMYYSYLLKLSCVVQSAEPQPAERRTNDLNVIDSGPPANTRHTLCTVINQVHEMTVDSAGSLRQR